jgi:2-polyprenyl-3-methyl-5-hydroxy-6-metoxy-1,4-benzoquinol methylase
VRPKIGMVKLGHIDDLCPDELWNRIVELDEAIAPRLAAMKNLTQALAACPVCGSRNLVPFTKKLGLRIDQCDACGFRFTNPAPSAEQRQLYYNSEVKQLENVVFDHTRQLRLPIFQRRVELIGQYVAGGKLLDVGGAIGIFIDALALAKLSFEISVVDLSYDAIAKLRTSHPQVTALLGDVFEHHGTYDVVTLWDTIEHIPDVNHTASHLFSLIRPGGFLFVSTPNIESFEHTVGRDRHPQVVPLSHVNYFSASNLRHLLERHGFAVVQHATPNGTFDVAYVNRMINDGDADLEQLGHFLRRQLRSSAFADDFAALISDHRLAGNVVMVAQRPAADRSPKG